MPIIDDDGNLLGLINVVDALVALLLLAVVAAGAAFALQPDSEPASRNTDTVNVTLDLGVQPDYIVQAVNEGDTYAPNGDSELTVTDVHLTPTPEGTRVYLRVRLRGLESENAITYADAPPRLGRELTVQTDTYTAKGTIRDVNGSNALRTDNTKVLLTATVPTAEARSMGVGDAYRVAGREVATVESLSTFATEDPAQKRVFVGLSLRTLTQDDRPRFGGTVLRAGAKIPFRTQSYAIEGTVDKVGTTERPGRQVTRTVALELDGVRPETADAVRVGMTEISGDRTLARITNVTRRNSTVILTSDGGEIYRREHPVNQDLTVTAELTVRETKSGITFKGEPLQQGSTVVLDLGHVTLRFRVASL